MSSFFARILQFFSSPRRDAVDKEALKDLLARLEQADFYKYMSPEAVPKARASAIEIGTIFDIEVIGEDQSEGSGSEDGTEETTKRGYFADAEDLAEGGVQQFLREVAPFLENQGVVLSSIEQNCDDQGYTICVNGMVYEIYSKTELETEEIWCLTTARTLGLINQLLEEASSNERAYSLYGGNEGLVVFLTRQLHQIIIESPDLPSSEKPEDMGVAPRRLEP